MRNESWTIAWSPNVKLPFSLHHGNENNGFFKTHAEAKQKHSELTK